MTETLKKLLLALTIGAAGGWIAHSLNLFQIFVFQK